MAGAGWRGGRNDGARVPASVAVYGLRNLAQREQVLEEGLTKGLWRLELRQKVEVDDDRRRRRSGARGPTATGRLRGSDHPGSPREAPTKVTKGLRVPGTQLRRRIEAAEQITGGGVVARFR
jgi:hypothetical protein